MSILFFGDSITAGENNHGFSFTDYMPITLTVRNMGISGTTVGEYSIFPVDGDSLLSEIAKNKPSIETADTIFLEYGINDVSAIMSGFVSERVVIVSFVKALDAIKQLNPNAKIYFLTISKNPLVVDEFAMRMCYYLNNDYFKGFDIQIPIRLWSMKYKNLITAISTKCDVIQMVEDAFPEDFFSDDRVHPSTAGHKYIAKNISKYI